MDFGKQKFIQHVNVNIIGSMYQTSDLQRSADNYAKLFELNTFSSINNSLIH